VRMFSVKTRQPTSIEVRWTSLTCACSTTISPTRTGERHYVTKAYLTFVAMDEHGKPQPVPPLELTSDEDQRRTADARRRRQDRLRAAGRRT
jgi:acyl-CoA hydrolase